MLSMIIVFMIGVILGMGVMGVIVIKGLGGNDE